MSATIVSLIRTWVPTLVGSLVAWLLVLGIEIDADAQAGLVVGLTGLLVSAYYGIVRVLERRWPWVGYLLGVPAEPTYDRRTETERLADEQADADRRSIVAALDYDPRVVPGPDADGHVRWAEPDTKGKREA